MIVLVMGFAFRVWVFQTVDALGAVYDHAAVRAEVDEFGFWVSFFFSSNFGLSRFVFSDDWFSSRSIRQPCEVLPEKDYN